MPIQFSTVAANADFLGEDSAPEGAAEGTPQTGDKLRDHGEPISARPPRKGDAKPGKDINAAGFVKDKDASKP